MTFAMIGASRDESSVRKKFLEGLQVAGNQYDQSDKQIDAYLGPYAAAGRDQLALLRSAMDPTQQARDFSMPDAPGSKPMWRDYRNRYGGGQQQQQADPFAALSHKAGAGLAGILSGLFKG